MTCSTSGRLKGVGNENFEVVVPADDVDTFAGQFVDNVFDAVATDADAGTDAIDPLVATADRDLRAVAGLSRHGAHFDDSIDNFGNLLLEQTLNELRSGSTEDHFDATSRFSHLENGCSYSLVDVMGFARNLFATRQNGFDVGQRDGCGAAFVSLNNAADHFADQLAVLVVQRIPLGFADLLNHHLLGSLSADTADGFFGVERLAIAGGGDGSLVAIDSNFDFSLFAIVLFGQRSAQPQSPRTRFLFRCSCRDEWHQRFSALH